jgi:hypothetical protein
VSPTAKHHAVGASTRRTGSIPFGNHQYALPRLVSRLVGIRCVPRIPAAHRSGRVQQRTRQSAARRAEATEEQLIHTVAPASIHSTRFAPPRPVWRSNWFASGSQACHENGVPTPVTTDYRNWCRILDKAAEKFLIKRPRNRLSGQRLRFRAIGVDSAALARLAARRSLMDRAGFRRLLPADLSAIVAPLFEVATTYPDHTSQKINSQLLPYSRALHPSLNSPSVACYR